MTAPFIPHITDFLPGMQFLHYILLEEIGAGGQGIVWSAIDQSSNQIIAIKFSESANTRDRELETDQFERQTRQLAVLRHPNILPLEDFGILQGIRYLVSSYIPGGSLQDQLSHRTLATPDVLRIARGIANALDYLHSQGIAHRDLKPANVLLDFNQNVYVSDFGLARSISASTQALHTGHGTPPYAPPEQHSKGEITLESDIFSFGIMLYEMFTGQLPWKGEQSLGIQQLYSREELPDPREINPLIPAGLGTLLRQMTAAHPAGRPKSATQITAALYTLFNLPLPASPQAPADSASNQPLNAETLIQKSLTRWDPTEGTVNLSLTKFAYLDLQHKRQPAPKSSPEIAHFMLYNALVYGYDDNYWWPKVENPRQRLEISGSLISKDNENITARLIGHILHDPTLRTLKTSPSPKIANALLDVALRTQDESLKNGILATLRLLTRPETRWQTASLDPTAENKLAILALENSATGDEAARLIGRLHSSTAITTLLKHAPRKRLTPALVMIQETAGSLPASLPLNLRFTTLIEWGWNRLSANPGQLFAAYSLLALGLAIGSGLQVYVTARLPGFMDITRLALAFERGLFLGVFFGLGLFVIRALTELFPEFPAAARFGAATLAGGAVITTTLLVYDLLFLKTTPSGPFFIIGCFIIASGYSLSGLVRPIMLKIILAYAGLVIALASSWFGHAWLTDSPFRLTPVFFYEYTWAPLRILLTILVISLPPAVLGSWPRLTSGTTTPPSH